jgi:hypothetical protein
VIKRTSPNKIIQSDETLLEEYKSRLTAARQKVKELGHGTQSQLARDLVTHPGWISRVLNGQVISLAALMQIEAWLKENYQKGE